VYRRQPSWPPLPFVSVEVDVTGVSRERSEQVGQTIAFRGLPTAPTPVDVTGVYQDLCCGPGEVANFPQRD